MSQQFYRLLTGPDDSAFCARVEKWLNKGWKLHGSPSVTSTAVNGAQLIVAQAIVKEVSGDYQGFVSLTEME